MKNQRLHIDEQTFKPPAGLTAKAEEKWISEQALLFEMEVQNQRVVVDKNITLAKYTEHWLEDIAPKKLALSTLAKDKLDIYSHAFDKTKKEASKKLEGIIKI